MIFGARFASTGLAVAGEQQGGGHDREEQRFEGSHAVFADASARRRQVLARSSIVAN
jgi:hypothetical protein